MSLGTPGPLDRETLAGFEPATRDGEPIPARVRFRYRITPPTLLVWGTEDAFVPPSYAESFASALPSAKVVRIEGSGHFVQLEALDEVVEAIADFAPGR